jgi:hypothetical protein
MRAHQLDADGVIINTIMVESLDFLPNLWDAAIGGQIGDSIINGQLVPAPPPAPPVPQEVTRRQGLQAIFLMYDMTQDQLEAKVTSIITDPTQQYLTLVEIRASQTFERQRPIVIQMGQALGWDLDALFIKAGSLP